MGSGLGGFAGWVAGAVECVYVCVEGGGGGEFGCQRSLRRWRTVPVSKLLLIISLITNQLANGTGPGGLTLAQPVQN